MQNPGEGGKRYVRVIVSFFFSSFFSMMSVHEKRAPSSHNLFFFIPPIIFKINPSSRNTTLLQTESPPGEMGF